MDPKVPEAPTRVRRLPFLLLLPTCLLLSAPALADGSGLISLHPVQGLRAAPFPLASLELFAQSTGLTLARRLALHDLQGGAALHLAEHLRLTASYRMLGIDLEDDADLESMSVEPGIVAPFLGLSVDF